MSIIKNFIIIIFLTTFISQTNAEEVKKMGKHKDWETYVINSDTGKVCFAHSLNLFYKLQKKIHEMLGYLLLLDLGKKLANEISITAGYEFNTKNSITATSGKNKYKFDIAQEGFAWITDNKLENKMIKTMKKGSRIMITGYNQKGSQTIDHYSLLGFTKAYNATKANCS